ncbi:hypothetical protein GGF31_005061 [Allomyces arbusculus]|nr:hypothetical protein GGF31_005061 [Allomyces arbusculus]
MGSSATRPARPHGHADAPPPPPTPPPNTPSDVPDDSIQLPRHAQQKLYLVNLVPPRGFGAGKYVPGHCFACAKCFATVPDTATAPEPCRALLDGKNCERAADLPPPEISKGVLVDMATVGMHVKNLLATSPYWNAVRRAARERDVPIVRFAITLCCSCLRYWNRAKRLDLNTAAAAATTPTPAPAAPAAAEPAAAPVRSASTAHPTPPPSTARGSPAKRTRAVAYRNDDTDEDDEVVLTPRKRAAVRARPTTQKPAAAPIRVPPVDMPSSSSSPAPPPVPAPATADPLHVKRALVLEFSAFNFGLAFDQNSLVPLEAPTRQGSEPHLVPRPPPPPPPPPPVGPEPTADGAAGAMPPALAAVSALMQRLSGMGAMANAKVELPTPFNPDPAGPAPAPPPAVPPAAVDSALTAATAPAPPPPAIPALPTAPAAHATPTAALAAHATPTGAATATPAPPPPPSNPTPASNELVLHVNFGVPAPLTAAAGPSTGPGAPGAAAAGTVIPGWSDADLAAVPHDQRPPVDVMVRLLVAQMRAKTREQMIALGHSREEIERELQRVWEF